jgi:hypothetical protein
MNARPRSPPLGRQDTRGATCCGCSSLVPPSRDRTAHGGPQRLGPSAAVDEPDVGLPRDVGPRSGPSVSLKPERRCPGFVSNTGRLSPRSPLGRPGDAFRCCLLSEKMTGSRPRRLGSTSCCLGFAVRSRGASIGQTQPLADALSVCPATLRR